MAVIVEENDGSGEWDEIYDESLALGEFVDLESAQECVSTLLNEIENNDWEFAGLVPEEEGDE